MIPCNEREKIKEREIKIIFEVYKDERERQNNFEVDK